MQAGCLPVAAIILAAGGSTRMGRPKQLLVYRGRTLVERAIDEAASAGLNPIVVVVGAEAASIQACIATRAVQVEHNPDWQKGIGSSISAGMKRIADIAPDCAAVAILLPDQPLVTAEHLREMRALLHREHAAIIAAEYGGTRGVPAFFKRELFGALQSLAGDAGARRLIRDANTRVASLPLPVAAVDLDTPEDVTAFETSPSISLRNAGNSCSG